MGKAVFVNYEELPLGTAPFEGVRVRPMLGDTFGFTIVRFDKGLYIPVTEHVHDDEQMGYCIKGKIEWIIRDDAGEWTQMVTEGMAYHLPPNAAHGIRVLEDSVYVEMWSGPPERHRENANNLGLNFGNTK